MHNTENRNYVDYLITDIKEIETQAPVLSSVLSETRIEETFEQLSHRLENLSNVYKIDSKTKEELALEIGRVKLIYLQK
jgi:acetolactate synthase small subunit